jgi:hypothetical protein
LARHFYFFDLTPFEIWVFNNLYQRVPEGPVGADGKGGQREGCIIDHTAVAAAKVLKTGLMESLVYTSLPKEHGIRIRTNTSFWGDNHLGISRQSVVFCNFPNGLYALMLVAAKLRYLAGPWWRSRQYLDMDRFE